MRAVALVLAAGEGVRLGTAEPKAFLEIGDESLVRRATRAACEASLIELVVVAAPPDAVDRTTRDLDGLDDVIVVPGGPTRQSSAAVALAAAASADAYLIHDAARAFAPSAMFDTICDSLDNCEAVIPVLPLIDTVKRVEGNHVVETLERSSLVRVQTPQGVRGDVYRRAHEQALADGFIGTDDAAIVERLGIAVRVVVGFPGNIKITTRGDVEMAKAFLEATS